MSTFNVDTISFANWKIKQENGELVFKNNDNQKFSLSNSSASLDIPLTNYINSSTSSQVSNLTSKSSAHNNDVIVIEDSEDSFQKKKLSVNTLLGDLTTNYQSSDTALQTNITNEKNKRENSQNNILKILNQLQSQINTIFSNLNSGSLTPTSLNIETVISQLTFTNNKAWVTSPFNITFDLTDQYSFWTGNYLGWDFYKSLLISASNGVLSNSSTDEEIKAWLHNVLLLQYGSNYTGSVDSATLEYDDYSHYLLSINLPSGTKPLFKGSNDPIPDDVTWRLDYALTPGDDTTLYSTIFSGTSDGNILTVVPENVECPVNGSGGVRVGHRSDVDSFIINTT